MKLYTGPLSMFGAKAQIAVAEKGIDAEIVMVPFDNRRLYDPKHPEVLRINPKAQVPVLVDGDLEIFDSTQIFEYLEDIKPEPPLWPAAPKSRARARLAELTSDEVFFAKVIPLLRLGDTAGAEAEPHLSALRAYYAALEPQIGEWIAGDSFSYADIAFVMAQYFATRFGARIPPELPKLTAWRARVHARPAVKAVIDPMRAYLATLGRPSPA
jgi:glutathione S-transferase